MRSLSEAVSDFRQISQNPKAQLDNYLKQGKKVVGCMPYYCPEELVHASGMIPFGLWGAETGVIDARRYLPAFICSIIQTTLELGIRGAYKGLSAVMIPILCDSLKSMDGNWRYGVKDIPVIPVAHAQNRKTLAGAEFTASQYNAVKRTLEEIAGRDIAIGDVRTSIDVYKKRNAAVRRFIDELAQRPGALKASERNAVFKSGYFMTAEEFTARVDELTDCIKAGPAAPNQSPGGGAVGSCLVTCGILADNTGLLKILDECKVSIIDDLVMHESLRYRFDAPDNDDPVMALAQMIGHIEGCPVLYDPGKKRADMLVDIVRHRAAKGVLFVMTKFCDPDEYDIVPLRKILDKNGIKSLSVEVDQQTTDTEQTRTAIETFCEMVS